MTQNQLTYHRDREQARHNAAVESETRRSNVARESETKRSNIAQETENFRSNLARENETSRHNFATEGETRRSNMAKEEETKRANTQNEYLKQLQIHTSDDANYLRYLELEPKVWTAAAALGKGSGSGLLGSLTDKAVSLGSLLGYGASHNGFIPSNWELYEQQIKGSPKSNSNWSEFWASSNPGTIGNHPTAPEEPEAIPQP